MYIHSKRVSHRCLITPTHGGVDLSNTFGDVTIDIQKEALGIHVHLLYRQSMNNNVAIAFEYGVLKRH